MEQRSRRVTMALRRLGPIGALAACLPMAVSSAGAPAEPDVFHRLVTGPTVRSWMLDRGYRASLEVDDYGDPLIQSASGGAKFQVFFYGCAADQEPRPCSTLVFAAGFATGGAGSLARMNAWNADAIFGRAYLDGEGDPWIEMPVNADGGMPAAQFANWLGHWDRVLGAFVRFIDR